MVAKNASSLAARLAAENEELRARLEEAEETLRAIRSGEVDAVVISGEHGRQVFTLQGADQSYRALIERMSEGALTLTPEGVILYSNRTFADMLGKPLEQVIGTALEEWLTPASREGLHKLLGLARSGTGRAELMTANGVSLQFSASRMMQEGQPDTLAVIATDLTERQRAEDALRESEQRFAALFRDIPLGAALITYPEGRYVQVNRAFERLLGWSAEEAIGQTPDSLGIKTGPDVLSRIGHELEQRGWVHDLDVTVQTRTGGLRTFLLNIDLASIGGLPYGLLTIQDITGRKQMEDALRESEQRFAALFNEGPLPAVVSTFPEGHFVSVNRAFEQVFGWSAGQVVGRTSLELGIQRHAQQSASAMAEAERSGSLRDREFTFFTRAGEARVFLVNLDVLRIGGRDYALQLWQDITERKRAEEEINQLNRALEREAATLESQVQARTAELQATNKELEAFSYSVSHDLRAPLRAIDGLSRILVEQYGPQLAPQAQHYLEVVRNSAQQMAQLLEDLLALSRLGRQELALREIHPALIVRHVIDELRPEREGRQVTFVVGDPHADPQDALPVCRADPGLLKQVYVNLLSNALKFTRTCPAPRIEIGWMQNDGQQAYYVKDNGIGFEMQYADRLFGVFQRLHGSEDYEGTGVGLAIVQRIISRHGGRIWAEAEPGRGATFYFTLPRGQSL